MCSTSNAATPGRDARPSTSSRAAPPPGGPCETAIGDAGDVDGGHRSPPPTARTASNRPPRGRRQSAAANGSSSEQPMGPFQERSCARRSPGAGRSSLVSGPTSSPIHPAGISRAGAIRRAACGREAVGRPQRRAAARAGARRRAARIGHRLAGVASPSLSSWRDAPTSHAVGGEEHEGHRAADQNRVGENTSEAVDHGGLVGDLDAADHHHEWMRGIVQKRREGIQLGLQPEPGRGRQQMRRRPRWTRGRGAAAPNASFTYRSSLSASSAANTG